MAHTKLMLFIIVCTFTGIGYFAYSDQHTTQQVVQKYVPPAVYQVFQTGDVGSMTVTALGPNAHTTIYQYQAQATNNPIQSTPDTILNKQPSQNVSAPQNESTLTTVAGATYGQTSLYNDVNSHLTADSYKIGTPVNLGGVWKLVVPDSCTLVNGQTQCRYVTPPLFTYTLKVTCKIPQNNHCTMPDILLTRQTDGNGAWTYKWDTSAETGQVSAGEFLVTNSIDSNVLDPNGAPIPNVLTKIVYLVD